MAELKLDGGQEESREERERGASERTQRRRRAEERERQGDLQSRLHAIFARLADALEGRGDYELAGMIREDQKAMVGGLASAVKRVPAMGGAVIGVLAILEPLIAFGRIFRLLLRRLGERRREALEGFEEVPAEELYAEPAPAPAPAAEVDLAGEERAPDIPLEGENVARPWDLSRE